ncbi:dual specificity testis-specific protein kinase 2-like [Symsagittifera roscoffensis]|uniref:dual specificity testis-specific protein kinase 2-like n=1 Tax=Symsagittifera roscoffensis TaxID=84072 RepID=UPI00307C64E3
MRGSSHNGFYQPNNTYNKLTSELNKLKVRNFNPGELTIFGNNQIGQGSRSSVFEAKINQSGEKIAAKTLDVFGRNRRTAKKPDDLLYYIDIFNSINHANILKFIGVSFDSNTFYELTEICDFDLEKFSHNYFFQGQQSFPDATYKKILTDTCEGMSYLHGAGVLHRDLKADNILLKRAADGVSWIAKVADFGLAKRVGSDKKVPRGPVKLNPPEALLCICSGCRVENNQDPISLHLSNLQIGTSSSTSVSNHRSQGCQHIYPFYTQSDVYMFGVMVYCISHKRDFFGRERTGQIAEKVKFGQRPVFDQRRVSNQLIKIISDCWEQDYTKRPSFENISLLINSF